MALFNSYCADIEEAYSRQGHKIGWRFLTGSKDNLKRTTPIAFVTLNPGGKDDPPDHPHESQEHGSAYLVESWNGLPPGQSKLQIQVGIMFALLAERMGGDYRELMNSTLMGHFIPFRSPDYASLVNKPESIAFAERLWSQVFNQIAPRLVITMDTLTFKHLHRIIKSQNSSLSEQHIQMPTGWGNYQAEIVRFGLPNYGVTLVRFPHLSRFTIFTSSKCKDSVLKLMDTLMNNQANRAKQEM